MSRWAWHMRKRVIYRKKPIFLKLALSTRQKDYREMYQLKNGILHRANRKIFALGQSYYPSFHPQKHPVPPDQDRVGEMKKDCADMAAAGFELVRLAAVGRVRRDNGKIVVDFPLSRALFRAGSSIAARIAMIAITTRSSIRVNNFLMVSSQK